MDGRWVSVEEVASHLGVVKETVYRWIEKRGLPAHRVGRLWKFQLAEVDDWVKSGDANGGEESHATESQGRNGAPRSRNQAADNGQG